MTDVHSREKRSYNMSRIKSRDTKLELKLKESLERKGFIYQPDEYGKPDFIHYRKKIVIFIDGFFWHKCLGCFKLPETNKEFWKKKINNNFKRDKEINLNYKNSGWKVVRIWEHEIKKSVSGRYLNY